MTDREQRQPSTERRPTLSRTSRDETAEGWGERPDGADSDEERYLRERPPHHEG